MQDYEKKELFDLLAAMEFSSKEKPAVLQDRDFMFELSTIKSEASESFSLAVCNGGDVLFSLDMVKYDKFHFFEKVHQPFAWDGDARDRYCEGEWESFLSEKDAWIDCPIEVSVRIQDLKITDESTIDKMLSSIGLQNVLENFYQESLSMPSTHDVSVEPVTPEEKAVFSVMNKISTIKKRN